jgi:hypothetical protein
MHRRIAAPHAFTNSNSLFSRYVTLQDVLPVLPSTFTGDGFKRFSVGANGYNSPDAPATIAPQKLMFNKYAAMFEYYSVISVSARFVPYNFTGEGSNKPSYSIIDMDGYLPLDNRGYMSYGNCNMAGPN